MWHEDRSLSIAAILTRGQSVTRHTHTRAVRRNAQYHIRQRTAVSNTRLHWVNYGLLAIALVLNILRHCEDNNN